MVYEMFLFLISLFYLIIIIFFSQEASTSVANTCNLFLKVVIPSIIPCYFFGNMLSAGGYVLEKIKKFFFFFPLKNGFIVYLISFICGFPTTVYLINDLVKNKELTPNEAKILIKSCGMCSPVFIFMIFNKGNFPIIYPIFLIFSILIYYVLVGIYYKFKYQQTSTNITNHNFDLFYILNNIPNILLSIFTIMIITNLILIPFKVFNINLYITDFLELTTGCNNIINYNFNPFIKLLMMSFLISTGGFCIILQSISGLKKEMEVSYIHPISFLFNRLICGIVTTIIFSLFLIFFK